MAQISLILNKKNFDLVASGEKKKEFRAMSDRNVALFCTNPDSEDVDFKEIESIRFFLGYAKNRPQITVSVLWIDTVEVEPDVFEFEISLGEILQDISNN